MKLSVIVLISILVISMVYSIYIQRQTNAVLVNYIEIQNLSMEKLRKRVGVIEKQLGINPLNAPTGVKEIR